MIWKIQKSIFILVLLVYSGFSLASVIPDKELTLASTKVVVWGHYEIQHMLFPNETWEIVVLVVPSTVRQGDLADIAKDFYSMYPKVRARFFSDEKLIKQYVMRDMYVNDKTGNVPEVDFPDSKWVKNHHLGNINNRTSRYKRAWILENRYGDLIEFL